jgi:CBS domain-containing protein
VPDPDHADDGRPYRVRLSFVLSDTTVETGGHLAAAAYLMNRANQTALIVVDDAERPIAIITEADLVRAVAHGADASQARITAWMSRNPATVQPSTTMAEAARMMVNIGSRHLPVVSQNRVVGMVAIGDILSAVQHSVRLASALVHVSDLARSLEFYQPLLQYPVTVRDPDAAVLAGPFGSQLCLRQAGAKSSGRSDDGVGLQLVSWTAGGRDDLDRCKELLEKRGGYVGLHTTEGISLLEGRDPDGLPVLIAHSGPDEALRDFVSPRSGSDGGSVPQC